MQNSRQLFLILFFSIISFAAVSQDKQLTLQDAVYMNPEVLPARVPQLQWMPDEDVYIFVKDKEVINVDAVSGKEQSLVSLDDINAGIADLEMDSLKRFPQISFTHDQYFRFTSKNKIFQFDFISKNLELKASLPKDAENIDVDEHNLSVAFTIENNLYMSYNNKSIPVTSDEDKNIVNGQTVHRNEFGISKGTFWSPKGNLIAFYRKDESEVADYPLVDIESRIASVKNIKYPMAGEKSEYVQLGVFDAKTNKTVFMKTAGPDDHYLTNISWDPSEKYIYISELNRDQNHLQLNKYNVATGELVKTLFEEKDDQYVEPEHTLTFFDQLPGQFIWFSERDGFQHLYLYKTDGKLIKQLTSGNWDVNELIGIDEKGRTLIIRATKDSPIQQNIYTVDINSGKVSRISPDHGTHQGQLSPTGNYMIDTYSSTDVAREYKLLDNQGNIIRIIQENMDPLKDYDLGEMSIFTVKSDNGDDLYCRLIKPSGFEAGKEYPVFFYVYGGPHSQLVSDSWLGAAGIFQNYMAQQGYVVFTMDNHGTENRGLEFEQAIHRNLGQLEVADQMKGVEYLKTLDFVDTTRMGVDGWSYGGFMTVSMMVKHPGVFQVACAGGPVIDWKYYEVMYGERYMDTPQTNPEGYKNANLLNFADQLEGDLLIIQGTMDPTVVWQNSLSFVKKCVDEGKQLDYFVYPGHEHNVRGKDRVHLYEKIRMYFDSHFKD